MSKKNEPTPRQVDARRAQKARGLAIVTWLKERAAAKEKALKAERKKKISRPSRGTDRVPARLKVSRTPGIPGTEWIVGHDGATRRHRRRVHLDTGRVMAPATNKPYINPNRDSKSARSGRLRKELQA